MPQVSPRRRWISRASSASRRASAGPVAPVGEEVGAQLEVAGQLPLEAGVLPAGADRRVHHVAQPLHVSGEHHGERPQQPRRTADLRQSRLVRRGHQAQPVLGPRGLPVVQLGVHLGEMGQVRPAAGLGEDLTRHRGRSVGAALPQRCGRTHGFGERVGGERHDLPAPGAGLDTQVAHLPVPDQGQDDAERLLLVAPGDGVPQGGAHVLVLALQPGDGLHLARAAQQRLGGAGEFTVVRQMGAFGVVACAGLVEAFARVLGDGLQQPVAHAAVARRGGHHQGLVDEGAQRVQGGGAAHGLGGGEVAAAA